MPAPGGNGIPWFSPLSRTGRSTATRSRRGEPRVFVFKDSGIRVDLQVEGGEEGRRLIATSTASVSDRGDPHPLEKLVLASDRSTDSPGRAFPRASHPSPRGRRNASEPLAHGVDGQSNEDFAARALPDRCAPDMSVLCLAQSIAPSPQPSLRGTSSARSPAECVTRV